MTLNPAEISRKVRQLDNDVDAIYSMLADVQGTLKRHGNRLDRIDTRLEGVESRLGTLDTKVDGLDVKVGALDAKVDGLDAKVGTLDSKLDQVLDRLP